MNEVTSRNIMTMYRSNGWVIMFQAKVVIGGQSLLDLMVFLLAILAWCFCMLACWGAVSLYDSRAREREE